MRTRTLAQLLTLGMVACSVGCSSIPMGSMFSSHKEIEVASTEHPVYKMVCLWEPSEGQDQNGMPRRGLKGQLMFFTPASELPVAVNGDIKLYQFDNYGPRETWSKPVHEFTFTAEQWNRFLQPGMMGPTYSVFIPYMRSHADQVHVTMQMKYIPRDGGSTLYSHTSSTALPGLLRDDIAVNLNHDPTPEANSLTTVKKKFIAHTLGSIPLNGNGRATVNFDPPADVIATVPLNSEPTIEQVNHTIPTETPKTTRLNLARNFSVIGATEEEEAKIEEPAATPRRQFRLSSAQ